MARRSLDRKWLLVAALLAATTILFAFPARSLAGCGGVRTAEPAHRHHSARPPLAIGDSTMLLALYDLAGIGYEANAHGCREFPEALALLRERKAHNALPHMVVIALGADGPVSHKDIGVALGLLCCSRLLVLVTPRELGGGSGADAAAVRDEAKRHHNRVLLLDWVRYSAGHGDWFQPDGLHLTTAGATAFTRLLARALPRAYPPGKNRRRKPHKHASDPQSGKTPPLVSSAAATTPIQPGSPLRIQLTLARVGYVGAKVSGPLGTNVQLSEQRQRSRRVITVLRLAGGSTNVPDALTWSCDLRDRQLVATTLPPVPPQQAIAIVRTPSCEHRLAAAVDRHARVGAGLTVRLRDRWGVGSLPLTICVAPPGASRECRPWRLDAGRPTRVLSVPATRPGGWNVTVMTNYGQKRITAVWVAHPGGRIRLLAAGDSEMQLLDDFLAQDLRSRGLEVTSDARISTGLTNSFFFDWQSHARAQAATLRPDVTVMFLGGNEGFPVAGQRGQRVFCCTPAWSAGYANLVARMMMTYLRGDAGRVYWFLLPVPRAGNFQRLFSAVNAGIREAGRRFPGRVALVDAASFFTPGDRYRDFMTYHGRGFVIHESDGVHLSVSSDGVAAQLVEHQLLADRLIR
jgi:lysophospholipase L1-like esterase